MRRLLYAVIFLIILFGCKKDDPEPVAEIKPLAGSWDLKAIEKINNGVATWENVSVLDASYLTFRFDGVLMDSNGKPECCPPDLLVINGSKVHVKPLADMTNERCILADCNGCAAWNIQINGSELILKTCNPSRLKYIRQ